MLTKRCGFCEVRYRREDSMFCESCSQPATRDLQLTRLLAGCSHGLPETKAVWWQCKLLLSSLVVESPHGICRECYAVRLDRLLPCDGKRDRQRSGRSVWHKSIFTGWHRNRCWQCAACKMRGAFYHLAERYFPGGYGDPYSPCACYYGEPSRFLSGVPPLCCSDPLTEFLNGVGIYLDPDTDRRVFLSYEEFLSGVHPGTWVADSFLSCGQHDPPPFNQTLLSYLRRFGFSGVGSPISKSESDRARCNKMEARAVLKRLSEDTLATLRVWHYGNECPRCGLSHSDDLHHKACTSGDRYSQEVLDRAVLAGCCVACCCTWSEVKTDKARVGSASLTAVWLRQHGGFEHNGFQPEVKA